jgi:ABC-type lipoprotein export system ATPase subunit
VTHEREIARRAGRTIELRDGLVVQDTLNPGGAHAAA